MNSLKSWSRTALLTGKIDESGPQIFHECLLITSPHFSDSTDWGYLESETFHNVSIFWVDIYGDFFEIADDARLMFLFVEEASKKSASGLLPITVEDFSSKVSPIVLSLGGRDPYRRLLSQTSSSLAKKILLKANDISALFAFKQTKREYRAARKHDLFDRGMLRTDEQRFTFISLQNILSEDAKETGIDIASLSVDVEIAPDVKLDVEFQFQGILGQTGPINVVIGPNGTGKTSLLLGIAANSLEQNLRIISPRPKESSDKWIRSVPISAYTFEKRHWNKLQRRGVHVTSLGISTDNWRNVSGIIQKIATLPQRGGFDLRALSQVLTKVLSVDNIYLPALPNSGHTMFIGKKDFIQFSALVENQGDQLVSLIDTRNPPVMFSEERGIYHLSSGQKSLFCFCAALFLNTSRGSLLLIDEPENHLHPQFITLLMQTLASSLIAKEAKAIVVTHSPFVVREVEKNSVLVLRTDEEGLPAIYKPSLQTFGADISLISDYIFEDVDIRKGYEEKIDDFIESPKIQISAELLSLLGQTFGSDAMSYVRNKYKDRFDA